MNSLDLNLTYLPNEECPQFIDIFRRSPISIEMYSKEGLLIDANQACLDLFGVESIDDIRGFNLFENPQLSESEIKSLISGKSVETELIYDFDLIRNLNIYPTSKSGKCYLNCVIYPSFGENNEITGYISNSLDTTKRKKAEEMLKLNEQNYRSLIQYSSDPIFSFNSDESYRFVNEAFAQPFGKPPEEIIGKTPFDIFPEEEAIKRLKIVRRVFETGEKAEIEVRVDAKSGDTLYFLTMADPVKNDVGEVIYVTCVSKDITDRKLAENALIESRERYRDLIEFAVDGVLIGSKDGYIIDANSCICEMSGRTREELLGLHISNSIFSPESLKSRPFRFDLLLKGETVVSERKIIKADGSLITIEMRTKMMPDETYQTIIRDISERKNAELILEKQAKELRELNATKDKFMSIIAHDLRSPFNAIIGFSDLMIKNFYELDNETFLKGLRTIESASHHAFKLLENLLIWSRNQSGRYKFLPEVVNVKTQVAESLNMVESEAINKKIKVSVSIIKAHKIFVDKNMLDTILRNLISNAIKFSYKGSKIKIAVTETDHQLQFSVSDSGVGISPERLASIFELDKRTNTTGTENEQGTGLGLILCKDFVTMHKGKIWAESTQGSGSCFTFSLPLENSSPELKNNE
ncbi:MAG: PAS domain-containing sensor histidine kinase [Prolixibacteraceae bacterium]|jgi:PAS domain S-box-containing protein